MHIGLSAPVLPTIMDSYSESNWSWNISIGSMYGIGMGQSFTGDGGTLNSAKFFLSINTATPPIGNCFAKIYAETHATVFGIDSIPTGGVLATSDGVNPALLGDSEALITFTFSGANKIVLANGTKYCVTIEYGGANFVRVGIDNTAPTAPGNGCDLGGFGWSARPDDTIFYVYKD
jgi:hypothetical protein